MGLLVMEETNVGMNHGDTALVTSINYALVISWSCRTCNERNSTLCNRRELVLFTSCENERESDITGFSAILTQLCYPVPTKQKLHAAELGMLRPQKLNQITTWGR